MTREELDAPFPPGERKVRVGVEKPVDMQVAFSDLRPNELTQTPRALPHGAIRGDGRGGFHWTGIIEASDAAALRLRFVNFSLPNNAELYLYNEQGVVVGPYTRRGPNGDGEFWSHTLRGSRITVQLSYEGSDTERALLAARFVLADLGYLDDRFVLALHGPTGKEQAGDGLCAGNAPCVENASCSNIPSAIQPAQDAAALILFASGPWFYICSGGLLADTDEGSAKPYFLTANHCISKNSEASSAETFFDYTVPCSGSCSGVPSVSSTLGASLLATGRAGDYTLLELDESPPADTVMLGWNSAPIAYSDTETLFRISHPAGSPQAYSEHEVDTSRPTCTSWPRGDWIYSSDTYGGTEGGSSGSPVLNSVGQVVGQLSGACGYNVGDSCDSVQNATVDGAFASYFSELAPFLDPNVSCTDADGDGFCAEGEDCVDSDAEIHPDATEICDDFLDNDCDGLVDGDDESCQTGATCDLFAAGDACSSDADCCSSKCRGRRGGKICR